jgi:hypothetical protein
MATKGGAITATDVQMVTQRQSAGAVATDRGGGTIIVKGGSATTYGFRSPGIYSTGNIKAQGTTFTAQGAEAAVIEGSNSIDLTDCSLTAYKSWGAMIYQSFSGDAQGRKGTFKMSGGSLTAKVGPAFYVNNTNAVIDLKSVKVQADSGTFLTAAAGRWGNQGRNGGHVLITLEDLSLAGDITADDISSVSAVLKGSTQVKGTLTNVSLTIADGAKWVVTGDSTLSGLTDDGISGSTISNIVGNGHTITYDSSQPACSALAGKTYNLAGGGTLRPR